MYYSHYANKNMPLWQKCRLDKLGTYIYEETWMIGRVKQFKYGKRHRLSWHTDSTGMFSVVQYISNWIFQSQGEWLDMEDDRRFRFLIKWNVLHDF